MCISCGCGSPNDDHGDSRNITLQDIDQAAVAAGTTRDRILQNITRGSQQDSSGNGQQPANSSTQSQQSDDNQSQAEQNKDAQAQAQPGTHQPSPGHDSGTAWGRDQEQINYQPPEQQQHTS